MRIESDLSLEKYRDTRKPGSYQWWYFDGISDDGLYAFTIIFYLGNPFSQRYIRALERLHSGKMSRAGHPGIADDKLGDAGNDETVAKAYPAISISVYKSGKPVYYGFREHQHDDAGFGSDRLTIRIGQNRIERECEEDRLIYRLSLNQKLPSGDRISGTLALESINFTLTEAEYDAETNAQADSKVRSETVVGEKEVETESLHLWNLLQPVSRVDGELNIDGYQEFRIPFSGKGYHDHNVGEEPMDALFRNWYWGRFHFGSLSLVYYLMEKHQKWQEHAWLVDSSGRARILRGDYFVEDRSRNLFGLKSGRKIRMEGQGSRFLIQQQKLIDNGPFYQRFLSQAVLETNGRLYKQRGITEFLNPGRIRRRIFWPLVHMRIVYPEKPHWVQKYPALYRWTW